VLRLVVSSPASYELINSDCRALSHDPGDCGRYCGCAIYPRLIRLSARAMLNLRTRAN
jgi:hypothetical protein